MPPFDKIDFKLICKVFWLRKWWMLILLTAGLTASSVFCHYRIKPVYCAYFTMFAWDGIQETQMNQPVPATPADSSTQVTNDLNMADKLLRDYEELMKSRYVHVRVSRMLDERQPELSGIPYRQKNIINGRSHFISCEFHSTSRRKAKAAAEATAEVFMEALTDLLKLKKMQMVDAPSLLPRPVNTIRYVLAFLGGTAGVIIGLFAFVVHELRWMRLDSPEAVAELDIPLMGTLPHLTWKHKTSGGKNVTVSGLKTAKNFDAFNDNLQLLITDLRHSIPQATGATVLMITSAMPGDGKSMLAGCLSAYLAQKDFRVLLIRGDIRKKPQNDNLEITAVPGLIDVAAGHLPVEDALRRRVGGRFLDVLPEGDAPPPDPLRIVELFHESGALEKLRSKYDYILIDTPPSGKFADVMVFRAMADEVLLLADVRRTPIAAVRGMIETLRRINPKILGIVLNHYRSMHSEYGYGYGYEYGYGYTAGRKTNDVRER